MTTKQALMAGVCGLPIHAQANGLNLATDYDGGLAFRASVAVRLWRLRCDGERIIEAAANHA